MKKIIVVLLMCVLSIAALALTTIDKPDAYSIVNTTTTNFTLNFSNYNQSCSLYTRLNRSDSYTRNITDFWVTNATFHGMINITSLSFRNGDRVWWYLSCVECSNVSDRTINLVNGRTNCNSTNATANLKNSTVRIFDVDTTYDTGIEIFSNLKIYGNLNVTGNLTVSGMNVTGSTPMYVCVHPTSKQLYASAYVNCTGV